MYVVMVQGRLRVHMRLCCVFATVCNLVHYCCIKGWWSVGLKGTLGRVGGSQGTPPEEHRHGLCGMQNIASCH